METLTRPEAPRLREISAAYCGDILSRNTVGRLAFTYQGKVNVIPIHYAYDGGWIYGRTSPGGKLKQILRDRRVAFEVDEYAGFFDWSSVVVQGIFYVVDRSSANSVFDHALSILRRSFPDTLTDSDPVPFRSELFRISVTTLTGRSASPEGGALIDPDPSQTTDRAVAEEDRRLRNEIIANLGKAPDGHPENVVVDVMGGLVVLTGVVETFGDIGPIERAALATQGVKVVLNEIEVGFTREFHTEPVELGNAALGSLKNLDCKNCDVRVVIETGWLRVEGTVPDEASHQTVIRQLRQVRGARGLVDRIHTL
jgi:nitroimidazol reductase NimA-like FMN-containing flavoprotein (pyridoxamine 5'-phosphate oxidase superfamily)/osmotically-inducible protein OsmY